MGKIPSENITIYRLGRHCIILSKPELVSSCILYKLVAGATMCVLTLSCLHSGVSFTLTLCSGSSPSPIAGRARDYRSEDIYEFSLFNCAHLKFTVYASKQTANIIRCTSLIPRLLYRAGGKRAWYTLFVHASSSLDNLHNTPLH